MLKSLFLRKKSEADEILPPPPPFPKMELEEGGTVLEEPKQPGHEAEEPFEFNDLLTDLDKEFVSKTLAKEPKQKVAKTREAKLSKKELKKIKKLQLKEAKQAKTKKQNEDLRDFGFLDEDFAAAEPKDNEFDVLEDFGVGYAGTQEELKQQPEEILEAQEEIENAIESAKKQEKQSILKKLFSGKKEAKLPIEIKEPEDIDDLSKIRNRINAARNSLMDLDIEAAKRDYIEIMEIYNQIKPEEQAKVYNDIKELYFERKSAEQLKV